MPSTLNEALFCPLSHTGTTGTRATASSRPAVGCHTESRAGRNRWVRCATSPARNSSSGTSLCRWRSSWRTPGTLRPAACRSGLTSTSWSASWGSSGASSSLATARSWGRACPSTCSSTSPSSRPHGWLATATNAPAGKRRSSAASYCTLIRKWRSSCSTKANPLRWRLWSYSCCSCCHCASCSRMGRISARAWRKAAGNGIVDWGSNSMEKRNGLRHCRNTASQRSEKQISRPLRPYYQTITLDSPGAKAESRVAARLSIFFTFPTYFTHYKCTTSKQALLVRNIE